MTRDQIVKWAEEAGIMPPGWGATENQWCSLERFAALVIAAERQRKAWDATYWTAYEHDVAAAEREACAKVCEEWLHGEWHNQGVVAAMMIRARGQV